MNRRTLLFGSLAGVTALVAWPVVSSSDEDIIEMVVRKRLDYLKLEPEGVRRFARDMVALHTVSRARLKILAGIKPIYTRFDLSAGDNWLSNLLRHGEDKIAASYLICSDFFTNNADETRQVQYAGLLDPLRACSNPFARRMV
jgi:hypothetical protein